MILPSDFRDRVINDRTASLVAFTARFCEASQELIPVLDKVSERFDGRGQVFAVDFGDDVAAAKESKLAARYKVNRLPAVMAFADGRPRDLIGGVSTFDDISDMLERQLRPVREIVGMRDFRREVLRAKDPVLVHFHAADCDPSKMLIPVIDDAAKRFRGRARVVRVEANIFNAGIMERYGAIRTPMVAAFDDGEMRDAIMGGMVPADQLREGDGLGRAVDHVSEMLEALI